MIIADTGYFLALFNKDDDFHTRALEVTREHSAEALITTWPVLTEVTYLITERGNGELVGKFWRRLIQEEVVLWNIPQEQLPTIPKLIKKYDNLPMDLADASLVLLAQHLDDGRIFSTDERDFNTYRFKQRKPFKNLMIA